LERVSVLWEGRGGDSSGGDLVWGGGGDKEDGEG
jgi:hypothetical protein